jgi:hypothetical protein
MLTYIEYAESAASLEKSRLFKDAAGDWQHAAAVARHAVNREWATTRAEYCNHAIHRPQWFENRKPAR